MKTIIWDVDDVLNDLMREWFEREWLPTHPDCRLTYGELKENPPEAILGIDRAEYIQSLDAFRCAGFARLRPVPEALSWFEKSGFQYRHLALSSTPLKTAHLSASWSFQHFGSWIRSFNIVPSARDGDGQTPVYDQTKKDFLLGFQHADILIVDDSEANILGARELGIPGLLMPRPRNQSRKTIQQAFEHMDDLLQG